MIDPMSHMYYSYSPYNYTLNNPVLFVDPDGTVVEFSDNTSKKDRRQFMRHQRRLNRRSKTARQQWKGLKRSENVHIIHVNETDSETGERLGTEVKLKGAINTKKGNGTDIFIDLDDTKIEGEEMPIEISLGHEEGHASRFDQGKVKEIDNSNINYLRDSPEQMVNKINENAEQQRIKEETEASHIENKIRAEYDPKQKNFGLRKVYSNIPKNRRTNGASKADVYPPVNVIKNGYRYYKKDKNK